MKTSHTNLYVSVEDKKSNTQTHKERDHLQITESSLSFQHLCFVPKHIESVPDQTKSSLKFLQPLEFWHKTKYHSKEDSDSRVKIVYVYIKNNYNYLDTLFLLKSNKSF